MGHVKDNVRVLQTSLFWGHMPSMGLNLLTNIANSNLNSYLFLDPTDLTGVVDAYVDVLYKYDLFVFDTLF